MREVRILATDEIKIVGNNEAFGLVDSGKATYDLHKKFNRQVRPIFRKKYRTR